MSLYLGDTLIAGTSGGGGNAVLANDQTFTGINTFDSSEVDGGIRVSRITSPANNSTNITLTNTGLGLTASSLNLNGLVVMGTSLTVTGTDVTINPFSVSKNFTVNKATSGTGFSYNSGTDTLTSEATTYEGIADQETGSFTPVFAQGGTEGTKTGFYERIGNVVTAVVEVVMAANTDISSLTMTLASLPYAFRSAGTRDVGMGTWWTGTSGVPFLASSSGVIVPSNTGVFFLDPSTNSFLSGSEVRGYIGFTMSYIIA